MKKLFGLLLTIIALGFAGCGEEEEAEDDASGLWSKGKLQGTWNGVCRTVSERYGQRIYTFEANTILYKNTEYSTSDCTGDKVNEIIGRGTFKLPGDTSDDDGDTLAKIDYTWTEFSWTFISDPTDATDWAVACGNLSPKHGMIDVLGQTCTVGEETLNFKAAVYGTLWRKDGNLYATDINSNADTEEGRSKAVNKTDGQMVLQEDAAQ